MAKRRESGFEIIASMPWQAGCVLGLVGFAVIRYGLGGMLVSSTNPFLAALGKTGAFAPFAWLILFVCWLGSLFSYIGRRRRKHLLETQTGLDSIRAMSWQAFEMLVGEAFRRQGYTVQETGLGGPDGGIDLQLRKEGRTVLVQCKQWRSRQVPVTVVREMFGLLTHHGASAVIIVSTGDYSADARRFATGKPIELIHGEQLLVMVRKAQTSNSRADQAPAPTATANSAPEPTEDAPLCPICASAMVRRENRRTRQPFWGCPGYPRCHGTRVIA